MESLVKRRYERVPRIIRPEREHDAAHHRAGPGDGADGKRERDAPGCARRERMRGQHAGTRRSWARSATTRGKRRRRRARTVGHVRELRVRAAGGHASLASAGCEPAIHLHELRTSARAGFARDARPAS
jgi:hypothetical protein